MNHTEALKITRKQGTEAMIREEELETRLMKHAVDEAEAIRRMVKRDMLRKAIALRQAEG
jgi:hypothetical protein